MHTFEFHEQRAEKAREDFKDHGISHLVTVTHRDVLEVRVVPLLGVETLGGRGNCHLENPSLFSS